MPSSFCFRLSVECFQLFSLFLEKLSKVPKLVWRLLWAWYGLREDVVNCNRETESKDVVLFLLYGLEWACSMFVRETRWALEGQSRFVLLMTFELYRHCWKCPEERLQLRNAFPLSDAALYSRAGTKEVIPSHMCVSVLLVVKCWSINTGPGRNVCLSDCVGEDIAIPAIVLHNKFLLPLFPSLSLSLPPTNYLNMIYYCEQL